MNKIAFITGATSGIGRATALKTAEAGYDLIITGRRKERLEELAQEIREKGREVLSLCFDV
ncbi:MAG: SDR family NAD(P)-dependent oxidoreductase, partial [Odoribacter sp.]|nr:SDR family NAD(P)-dependent oxidoreductase [Odoribacter sp.]